ncbi:PREDICTED: ATP synthase subunit f, mitochondrial [Charadrius vociferus]|uniref:ATP synthase subunit f, mitochondrial n=1 Tax=Charadrius vociferus TaxID=50402 RepID=UPI0005218A02|nr:PREDICTED: ATP synthase subunit f, mitochondrial [Charadrius vociferus]
MGNRSPPVRRLEGYKATERPSPPQRLHTGGWEEQPDAPNMAPGYDRYYNKYINVKKGGLGGISMVLAGYVVISYIWSYSHIKHDRHRKYH